MLLNNPLKQKYYSYLREQNVKLTNEEIEEDDIMGEYEYIQSLKDEQLDMEYEDRIDRAMFKFE